jgi:hypothetical protein
MTAQGRGGDAGRRGESTLSVTFGAKWCDLVYSEGMGATNKSFRQSVSLPARLAKRVKSLAKSQRTSANRVLLDLIESGLESKDQEKERFFLLAGRLAESGDPAERERLKKELARMTFGE